MSQQTRPTLIVRLWNLIVRWLGLRGLATVALLWLALAAFSAGLVAVVDGLGPLKDLFGLFSAAGILAGWKTRPGRGRSARLAGWFALGALAIFLQNAGLWDEIYGLLGAGMDYAAGWLRVSLQNRPENALPAAGPVQFALLRLQDLVRVELDAFAAWSAGLLAGEPAFQVNPVTLAWGFAVWAAALFAGAVMRASGSALTALLPAGLLLLIANAYTGQQRMGSLLLFLLAALLLTAFQTQVFNERRWGRRAILFAEELRIDFSFGAAALVAAVILAASVFPSIRLEAAVRSLLNLGREERTGAADPDRSLPGSVGLLPPTAVPPFFEQFRSGGLPQDHLLGAGPELADQIDLSVRVFGETSPGAGGYYWRGLSYSIYNGRGWETGVTDTGWFEPGQAVRLPPLAFTRPVRQEVDVLRPQNQIAYSAGDILAMDRAFTLAWHMPSDGVIDPFGVRVSASEFTVDSRYPYFFVDLLRQAGTEYPDWVVNRYLELPSTIPDRVRTLAAGIAAGAATPYDTAVAVERYLRGFEYTLDLGPPPQDRDIVDYFLFDLQRGYCDYYASAMVVMARSLGLPARLAIGYAGGAYEEELEVYLISALDAHSWPELYFPGFGWVPFEPTAGLPEISREEGSGREIPPPQELPPLPASSPAWPAVLGWILAAVPLFAGFLLSGRVVLEVVRFRRLDPDEFYEAVFRWLYAAGRRIGAQPPPRATPLEFRRALAKRLDGIQQHSRFLQRLPTWEPELDRLTRAYVQAQYAREGPEIDERAEGFRAWLRLRVLIAAARLALQLEAARPWRPPPPEGR